MEKKWYQQFWPWFLILLPMCAVVAGISTVIIAVNNKVELVASDTIKDGKILTEDLSKYEAAQAAGAHYQTKIYGGILFLIATGEAKPEKLILSLYHPTQSERDLSFELELSDNRYPLPDLLTKEGEWELRLEPEDASWRLQRRLNFPLLEDTEFGLKL